MRIDRARTLASLIVVATPLLLYALMAARGHGRCGHHILTSYALFALLGFGLIFTKNPFRAIAACVAYIPVGYLFAAEPCTAARSQGAGGLIYLISPIFAVFVIVAAFVGGFMLRATFGLQAEPASQAAEGSCVLP